MLASGEGISITAAELRARLEGEPASAYASLEKKREALDKLIDFELLVAEARRAGLDRDPEILSATKLLMVQQLLRNRQAQSTGAPIPTEEQLRAQFEAEKERHASPETVRLAHLFLKAPSASERGQRLGEARALREQALALPAGAPGTLAFAELARTRSDEASTAINGGDLTYRSQQQLELFYSKQAAAGAFALEEEGQLSDVFESPHGLHLFRLLARTPARIPSFAEYRAAQSAPVSRAAREEEIRLYCKGLRERARVVVREEDLERFDPLSSVNRP